MTALIDRFLPSIQAISSDDNGWVNASPLSDYWYTSRGGMSAAGMRVSAETALRISAFFACLRVLGETVLSAPLKVYRRLPNGDREEAPQHPLWPILHGDEPNEEQTSGEWLETHTIHTAMRGTSYSEMISGPRGPISRMKYLHPDRVRIERLSSGGIRYQVQDEQSGIERVVGVERMFRLPGLSSNGVTGLSVLEHARDSLGISLALQRHASSSFSNGVRPAAVLEYPGKFTDEALQKRLRAQWEETYSGAANAGKTVILENDMKYRQVSMSNEDAQMLGSEQWQVADIARWFRVPLVFLDSEKGTTWGSGVEQQMLGFIVFTMLPWFVRLEARINKQLVRALGGDFFCEFVIEGLLRGDIKSRYEAYATAAGGNAPWMNRNELRKRENLNRGPKELDEFLQPMNMGPAGLEPQPRGTVGRAAAMSNTPASADPRTRGYAAVLAKGIVRKESEAVRKAATRFANDGAGWEGWLNTFYEGLGGEISDRCYVEPDVARRYAERQRDALLWQGATAAEANEGAKADELVGLMLGAVSEPNPISRKRVERDAAGRITGIVEESV